MTSLNDVLESSALTKVAGGMSFTEGPLWHPDGFFYFVDLFANRLYRLVPGGTPELVRTTEGGNGTTFDLQGRLIHCEGDGRKVTRLERDGTVTTIADRIDGKRLSRPNDVICHSNGMLLFTDPDFRVPLAQREIGHAAVYRIAPDGSVSEFLRVEYPNGLALSRDERTLYVANTRWTQYIHAVELDSAGNVVRRRIFADMSADGTSGVPDGMKIDEAGRVFCTGTGGVWVFEPDGRLIGIIAMPEVCANIAFGGPDLRTLLLTASTSVYTLRTKVPGLPHPWYSLRKA
ncbi:SMP-30/gluconolactonase/LRE family protein [Rhodopila sp.]|uniref:SMP-30/gluconolactonase/LRE family protein n=1 Tax=Rhodopila sp. TaxID=2480087 RepID=UPI002CB40FDA|nr:SMP-30/gluconolactonase/LRE family protein [Rhodopila sp.]HVZ06885.1 SMP-30/gluconolactonase/LRE family protein [Rhodopila sp.]